MDANTNTALPNLPSSMQHTVVLVVDDDPTILDMFNQALSPHYRVFSAQSGEEAIGFCAQHAPDIVLLDLHMPELDGLMTCKMLKAIPNMANCPIVFTTADTTLERELECWDAGATDFVTKPIVMQSIVKRIGAHIQVKLHSDLRDNMVFIDAVTGLYNRRYFNDFYDKQISLAQRNESPLSLIMFELESHRLFESEDRKEPADACLKHVAEVITEQLSRPTDTVIRFNASRFAVLLPDTYIFGAKHIAQKVLIAMNENASSKRHPQLEQMVLTAGLASLEALPRSLELLEQAERSLQQNKQPDNNLATQARLSVRIQ